MKYRWKLLILFLCISVIPIVGLRTFGIHNVRLMAAALSENIEKSSLEDARNRLYVLNSQIAAGIGKSMREVEMALFLQAFEVNRKLQSDNGDRAEAGASAPPGEPVTFGKGSPSADPDRAPNAGDLTALEPPAPPLQPPLTGKLSPSIQPIFEAISHRLGGLALRQYVRLENGASIEYPWKPVDAGSRDMGEDDWYRAARRDRFSPWTPPYVDSLSNTVVMTAYQPLEDAAENFLGATGIMVPLEALIEPHTMLGETPPETLLMACSLEHMPESEKTGAKIVFRFSRKAIEEYPPGQTRWLASSDSGQLRGIINDFAARKAEVREMPYGGQPSFWVYGPLPNQGTAYLLIVSKEVFLHPTHSMLQSIGGRVARVENLTVSFLLFLVISVTILALKFSRTVTRPLDTLSKAASGLAEGNLGMRVELQTRDEFQDLAKVLNSVGPQLKEHYQARRAMEVAMEIQQHLLPQYSPEVAGMEIYGMTIYSDETGGDYFDYLCKGKRETGELCIAVGDVAGHGIPSALLMATARGLIRQRATFPGKIDDIVRDVNTQFAEDVGDSGEFMTLLLARIDTRRNRIAWVRAGHDPAILYDPDQDLFTELGGGKGLPLGVMPDVMYTQSVAEIRSGQILCFGTDGIWEARNPAGEQFGIHRLKQAIRRYAEESAQMIVLSVIDEVQEFREAFQQEDDLTFLAVRVI